VTAVADRYRALVAAGELKPDRDQERAVADLDALAQKLADAPAKGSIIWRMLGKAQPPPAGLYMYGGVGRGKSMLMDLAFHCIACEPKRRVHFHEFMAEVHGRLRAERAKEEGDPIPAVAEGIAGQAKLLCFDELVVNNSADAMILSRLFTHLLDAGVTVIATSNRRPGDLYLGGLNRELFLPFIRLLEEKLVLVRLDGPVDYRLERLGGMPTWHVPNGAQATAAVREAFFRLTDYPPEDSANVPTEELAIPGGRTLHVPKSLKGVAVFSFRRLCGEPRGAADYLAIARRFHTIIIVGIPLMGPDNRNEAARFVTLIDALYEQKVKLLASADADPDRLYVAGDGAFEFERTASRLMEMQSADYLALGHGEE